MGLRGRKRRLGIESEYWRLLATGLGTVAACREVGIGRKTGYRWRAESGGISPSRMAEQELSSRYLSLLERHRIATWRAQGCGVRDIARRIGRAPSTVSRECRRNLSPHDHDRYDGDLAQARARERAHRRRRTILAEDDELRDVVQVKLELDWSPEQVAAWLRQQYPLNLAWHVCHETIYQALYHGGKGGLSRKLTLHLRTGRALRRRRRRRRRGRRTNQRTVRFVAPARLLEHRPPIVEDRTRIGDWEGDLIVGRGNRSAIGTLVDRTSRYVKLVYLPGTRRASDLQAAMAQTMATLPAKAWLTLTWDKGSEMAHHDKIATGFPDGVYFAHPGCPWQRGSNENTNGLLRQYFPKYTDLSIYSLADLRAVEKRLKYRPRKTLRWQTPAAVFATGTAS